MSEHEQEPTIDWEGIMKVSTDLDDEMLKVREQEHVLADAMRDLVTAVFDKNNYDRLPLRKIKDRSEGGYILLYTGIGALLKDKSWPDGNGGYKGCDLVLGVRKKNNAIVTVWQSYHGYTGRGMYMEDLFVPEDQDDNLFTDASDSEIATGAVDLAKSILITLSGNLTGSHQYLEILQALVKSYEASLRNSEATVSEVIESPGEV